MFIFWLKLTNFLMCMVVSDFPTQFSPKLPTSLLQSGSHRTILSMGELFDERTYVVCIGRIRGQSWQNGQFVLTFLDSETRFLLNLPAEFSVSRSHSTVSYILKLSQK